MAIASRCCARVDHRALVAALGVESSPSLLAGAGLCATLTSSLYILAKKVFAAGRSEMMHRTLRAADGIIDGRR